MESSIPITPELIRQLQKELKRSHALARESLEKARALEAILDSAKVIAPDAFQGADLLDLTDEIGDIEFGEIPVASNRQVTLPEAILSAVREAPKGIHKRELRERLQQEFPGIKLGRDGTYFYRTVRRMLGDGRLRETAGKKLKERT